MCCRVQQEKTKKPEKCEKTENKPAEDSHWYQPLSTRVKQSKSRELRASVLYVNCDCEKRDGLQDDCQRMECHGSPECLTHPPTCGPSAFASGKHLERKRELGRAGLKGETQSSGKADTGVTNGDDDCEEYQYCCIPVCCVPVVR